MVFLFPSNRSSGICAILGTTYTGEYEDIKAINDLLVEKKLDCPIHVDAASGGFVAPFVDPDLVWDFRLEKVISINVSGHKYGLVSVHMIMNHNMVVTDGPPIRYTPAWAGVSGALPSFFPKSSSSTSTTSEPTKPPLP